MIKKIFLVIFSLFIQSLNAQQTISDKLYGQNAWTPTVYQDHSTTPSRNFYATSGVNSCSYCTTVTSETLIGSSYGPLDNFWSLINASSAKMIRVGGEGFNSPKPQAVWAYRWQVDKIKNNGMVPVVQVGIGSKIDNSDLNFGVPSATAIVKYLNIDNPASYCKYWIVGNEPDLNGFSANQIFNIYSTVVPAMKFVDPNIIIIGPALSGYNPTLITSLTTGSTSILPFIDVFSFHYYPFGNEAVQASTLSTKYEIDATRYNVMNVLTGTNSVSFANGATVTKFDNILSNLSSIGKPIAITEGNICYRNDIGTGAGSNTVVGADNSIDGNGTNGFIAGQFWAEMFAVGMKKNLNMLNFWSAVEGYNGDNYGTNIGYLNTSTVSATFGGVVGAKKPTYHHYKMMADNFKGTYYSALSVNQPNLKAFAAKSGDRIAVMILNQQLSTDPSLPFKVRLNGGTPPTSGLDVTFSITAANGGSGYTSTSTSTGNITGESTVLLIFNCKGDFVERYDYKKNDIAPVRTETSTITLMGPLAFGPQPLPISPNSTAVATFSPTGYNWAWQSTNCGTVTSSGSTVTFTACNGTNLAVYTFTATDALGCSISQNVNVIGDYVTSNTGNALQAGLGPIGASGCAAASGSAIVSASKGQYPYSFRWDNGSYSAISVNSPTFSVITGLAVGPHKVDIKDNGGAVVTKYFTVPASGPLPSIYAGPDIISARSCTFALNATPNVSGNTYKWFKGNSGLPFALSASTITGTWATDVFRVEVTTPAGCKNSDNLIVTTTLKSCYETGGGVPCPVSPPTAKTAAPAIDNITSSQTISADQYINKIIKVHNNAVLTITECELAFSENSKIIVQPGGQLVILNAYLHGCNSFYWQGIEVNGNYSNSDQLSISGSVLSYATYPVKTDKTIGIVITDNIFYQGTTAIDLDRNKDFSITANSFYNYDVAINTTRTPVANVSSLIRENTFENVKRAIVLNNDDHSKLDIKCNKFKNYTEYAIYSENTVLKDQGASSTGAANTFTSSSTLVNHQLRHNGNTMNYYSDPSNPISLTTSSTLKATAQVAINDGPCYGEAVRMSNAAFTEASAHKFAEISFNAFPNPFRDQLTIVYTLPANSKGGTLKIFEAASGKEIFTSSLIEGQNKIELNDFNVAAGMYICTLFAGDGSSKSFKLVNIK